MKKRILSVVLALAVVLSLGTTAFATQNGLFVTAKPGVYSDVTADKWYYDEVMYVTEEGLMGSTGGTKFEPLTYTTRGMLMTILARLDGVDTTGTPWYKAGMEWAVAKGVSDGTNPTGLITREQIAVMLWRYAGNHIVIQNMNGFVDADETSDWAVNGVMWAVGTGVLTGKDGDRLDPTGVATRAELATMLYRFCENVLPGGGAIPPVHTHGCVSVVVTDPTCAEVGYTTYYCMCGYSTTDNYVPATGKHNWGEWTPNYDGTHFKVCSGGCITSDDCTFENGTCTDCGFEENAVAMIGETYYATLEEALAAAQDGDTVVMLVDIKMESDKTAPYGNKYAVKMDGSILDGNGKELYMECYGDDYGIMTSGGTIKNLTIKEGCRAIMIMSPTKDIILDNVKLGGDGVLYPINTGEYATVDGVDLIVTNSAIKGWTSFAGIASASFTNCEFGQGTYYNNIYGRVLKPYVNTTLTDCSFIEHMNLDLSGLAEGHKVAFNNCTVNGQPVTISVFTVPSSDDDYDTELFTVDLPSWATSVSDCILIDGYTVISGSYTSTKEVSGNVKFENITITATEGPAVKVTGDTNLVIEGTVSLTGATNGIEVPAGTTLNLTGENGVLVVEGKAGSGIGNVGTTVGTITIDGLKSLTATANGEHAFGIGGNVDGPITIKNTTIESVIGGCPQSEFVNDTKYGKSEPEGGAAIGVGGGISGTIVLDNVVIKEAVGGSKAAAIGAQYHSGVTITITNSILTNIQGGNASAGIGGSRISDASTSGTVNTAENITITIVDSSIEAKGGQAGAGIGSGYDTRCGTSQPMCTINISGSSRIVAVGGKYAAGIGTGYHHAQLSGTIEASVVTTGTASGDKFYKDSYTQAQDIGFGVVDPAREAADNDSYIMVGTDKIVIPDVQ